MEETNKIYNALEESALTTLQDLYGSQNLSSWSLFQGGYINFGYWDNIPKEHEISTEERIKSAARMYSEVAKRLQITPSDLLLEVGCGTGIGLKQLVTEYAPSFAIGIDASQHQLERARSQTDNIQDSIAFIHGYAENFGKAQGPYDKILSIEAMQHFFSIDGFLKESYKHLVDGGKLSTASFMFHSPLPDHVLAAFPNFESGIDKVLLASDFVKKCKQQGFKHVQIESIGQNVWEGFNKWIMQTEFSGTWNRNWKIAYDAQVIDYYIVTCTK